MPGLPAVANNVDDLAGALTDSVTGGLSRERLHSVGVEAFQGYLFSHPIPAPEFHELLNRSPLPIPNS